MNKKVVFSVIGVLALTASVAMKVIGSNSSHLSELSEFWWIPLPLALLAFLVAGTTKSKT